MSTVPYYDHQALEFAKGTLELRKQRNRKRTVTGEYVWSEEADLVFALGLIEWTKNPSCRAGERRSFFLERFLRERGIIKTRKQIASRLQVLKGEWNNTPYQDLLRNPEDTIESMRNSITPPLQDYKTPSNNPLLTAATKHHSRALLQGGNVSSVPVPSTTSLNAGQSVYPSSYLESRQSSHPAYSMSSYGTATYSETRAEAHRYTNPYSSANSGGENAGSYTPHTEVQSPDYHVNLTYGMAPQHDLAWSHRDYYSGLTDSTSPSY